jgi:hypothetical protein
MQPEPDSRGGRLMIWIVGVMGVLIIVGFTILLVEVGRRMFTPKPAGPELPSASAPASSPPGAVRAFGPVSVPIPEGARVESLTGDGHRLVAHVRSRDGTSVGYVIDAATGALLGTIQFPATKQP